MYVFRVGKQVKALEALQEVLGNLELHACQRRMASLCADLQITSAQLRSVPTHYYTLTYEQRMALLEVCVCVYVCMIYVCVLDGAAHWYTLHVYM